MIRRLAIFVTAVWMAQPGLAGSWSEFVAHCLDPYEVFSLPVTDYPVMEPDHRPQEFSTDAIFYGPTESGGVMVTDPLPAEGERACAILGQTGDADLFRLWRADQLKAGRYQQETTGALLSTEWIEPRIRLHGHVTGDHATYRIVETDLES